MTTIIIGIRQMIGIDDAQTARNLVMATALLARLPPFGIVLAVQRWFVTRLIEPEKYPRDRAAGPDHFILPAMQHGNQLFWARL
jgi:hypothetical protein